MHDHFDVVLGIVERHGGALVKTIGDAVMAAFADDLAAVAASIEMLHAFDKFRREVPNGERTHLKLGLFRGPSFLVNANGVLDYFGQTVNIAARLQAQAASGELVIEADARRPGGAVGQAAGDGGARSAIARRSRA